MRAPLMPRGVPQGDGAAQGVDARVVVSQFQFP